MIQFTPTTALPVEDCMPHTFGVILATLVGMSVERIRLFMPGPARQGWILTQH
jgi:hypothetical protein